MFLTVQVRLWWISVALLFVAFVAGAQTPMSERYGVALHKPVAQRNTSDWLLRMHEASQRKAYIGTLVVSSGGHMVSSRIWHVCDGAQQMDRIESLSGPQRSIFRHNAEVITFSPQSKVALVETRESLGMFPGFLKSPSAAIDEFYTARLVGSERIAGFDADVVQIEPKDQLRFAYQIWSEKQSGLLLRLQTLDEQKRVLEQVAFSELQLDAPVSMSKLIQMMGKTQDYRVERLEIIKTSAEAEGWRLKNPITGFEPISCHRRSGSGGLNTGSSSIQWLFSDGLATVSVFIEGFVPGHHGPEGLRMMGATHALARRVPDKAGEWWLTVVGEVPVQTLQAFAQALERRK